MSESGDIKLILFDYGGVIAPEGFQLGILKLAHIFGKSFDEMYDIAGYRSGLDNGYTTGKTDEDHYWKSIADILRVPDDLKKYRYVYLDNFQPRAGMIEIINSIDDHQLGIFSDQTNWIYELDRTYDFMRLFNYLCISCDKGYTKHDEEFYDIPSKETGIPAENILLIDDKPRVIENARSHGMKGYHFTSIDECRTCLNEIL
ncbi:MAG: HAD-IA family hydrolase [Elusimicrobiota bacterium]|nr:HAD-IA family hydrolase [Elusimicrobiota bacterium]